MAKFFSASFYAFEMLIFGKLMKRRFQWYIGLPTFLLLFLLCVQSSKSCCEGSILTDPPLRLKEAKRHFLVFFFHSNGLLLFLWQLSIIRTFSNSNVFLVPWLFELTNVNCSKNLSERCENIFNSWKILFRKILGWFRELLVDVR